MKTLNRRQYLKYSLMASSTLYLNHHLTGCGGGGGGSNREPDGSSASTPPTPTMMSHLEHIGPLQNADHNGVRLPIGFSSRIIAQSGQSVVPSSAFVWHGSPDDGATFAMANGDFVYVSNSELDNGLGSVSALRISHDFSIIDAYPILNNSSRNCSGGALSNGHWLSCEERSGGQVFECDPSGQNTAIIRPALGIFQHESVAEDTTTHQLYLTEDRVDGRLYRFTPDTPFLNLSSGRLEVAQVLGGELTGPVVWHEILDSSGASVATRLQVPDSTAFNGGEGIVFNNGVITFVTKGDNRIFNYDTQTGMLSLLYDDDFFQEPILTGVDNITSTFGSEFLVAEDGGDLQLVIVDAQGVARPLLQLVGHDRSEITGPAFDPSFQRLYFSSQRGTSGDIFNGGVTFEISGPFLTIA